MDPGSTALWLSLLMAAAPARPGPTGPDPAEATTTASAEHGAYGGSPEGRRTPPGHVERTLAGHVFTPMLLVRLPFAVTKVGVDLAYGAGSAEGKKPTLLDRDRGDATYEFAVMGQSFTYDRQVADGVSVGGGLVVELYSGITGPSAVVLGLEVGAGLLGNVTAGRQYGPVRVAFTLDASYAPEYGLHLLEAIQAASTPDGSVSASALTSSNAWTATPGFALAFTAAPAVGLAVAADYRAVWYDTSEQGWRYRSGLDAAVGVDVDLGILTRVPMAVTAALRTAVPVGVGGVSRVLDGSLGVFYTGRPALVLGAELGQRRFRYRGELDAVASIVQLRVQYLW